MKIGSLFFLILLKTLNMLSTLKKLKKYYIFNKKGLDKIENLFKANVEAKKSIIKEIRK